MKRTDQEQPEWHKDVVPSKEQVNVAYTRPHEPEHWARIDQILTHGFSAAQEKISWPTPELKKADYEVFMLVVNIVIASLRMSDQEFSRILPQIFAQLEKTYLFSKLFEVVSISQGNTVRHHIETVPQLLDTQGATVQETLVLRLAAIFHDIGKAFDIGRDQLHYHALIAATILKEFLQENKAEIMRRLFQYEINSGESILLNPEFVALSGGIAKVAATSSSSEVKTQLSAGYDQLVLQTTELIRVHHVLEQIDKDQLDLETVALLFTENDINPMLVGLFVVADGTSVVPDNEKYAQFLIENLNVLAQIIDTLEQHQLLEEITRYQPQSAEALQESLRLKEIYAQALIHVIEKLLAFIQEIPDKVKEIVRDMIEKIDIVLAQALLSLVGPEPEPLVARA